MSFLKTDQNLARDSYYAATAQRELNHPRLEGDVAADVCVVGGGLAGLNAAIELRDRGYQVVLLEAKTMGWGASGRNGGQALAGLACDQSVIESQLGMEKSRQVWDMTLEALDLIHDRRERFGIDCDWQAGYLALAVKDSKSRELRQWQERMAQAYGYQTEWIDNQNMPQWIASPRYVGGCFDARSGHLHPLKYSLGLAKAAHEIGVQMYEDSAVQNIQPGLTATVKTAHGQVRAKHVLLAGNVYLQGVAPQLEARIMPVGTYIVTSEPLDPQVAKQLIPSRACVCDTNFVLDYFRPTADDRLLYGGRVSYSGATPFALAETMRKRMTSTFPQLKGVKVTHAWGGFVDITMNRAPDFGRISDRMGGRGLEAKAWSNVSYLQGFSGHGLALTGLAGLIAAEAIHGQASRFDTFAALKHRRFPGGSLLRTPALVAAMAYYRLKDML